MGMQVEYKLKLGNDEFTLKADVKDEKEFFEQMSFYSNLPRTAPNGATDLKLVFRTTKKGHKYYSLISEQEQMEFKLGQNLEANGGGLFPKGWAKAHGADDDGEQTYAANPAPTIGQAIPAVGAPPKAASTPAPAGLPTIGQSIPSSIPTPAPAAAAPTPAPTPAPAANAEVAAVANNVLARFGIQQK
jgi:hypothetical protein